MIYSLIRRLSFYPTALGLFSLLLWSTGASTIVSIGELPQFQFASIVFGSVFFVAATSLLIRGNWRSLKASKKTWALILTGLPIQQVLYIFSYKTCPPEEIDILIYLWPIMALLMMFFFLKTKLGTRHIFSACLGFGAVLLLAWKADGGFHGFSIGHLSALSCALLWAVFTVFIEDSSNIQLDMIGLSYGLGFLVSILMHVNTETFVMPSAPQLLGLGYYTIFIATLPFWLWTKAVQQGNSILLTTTSYLKPVISIFILCSLGFAKLTFTLSLAASFVVLAGLLSNDSVIKTLSYAFKRTTLPVLKNI